MQNRYICKQKNRDMKREHFTLPYDGGLIEKDLPKGLGALVQMESRARSGSVASCPTLPPPAQTLPSQAEGQTYSQKVTLLASSASTQEDKTLQAE